jgi:hypothetical protein
MKEKKRNWFVGIILSTCMLLALFAACTDPEDNSKTTAKPSTFTASKVANFDSTNGDFNIVPATAVEAGTNINLWVTPVAGATVREIIISGTPVVPVTTVVANERYSFQMPARNVTVNIIFNRPAAPGEYSIAKGTVDLAKGNFTINPSDPQLPGTDITVTTAPLSNYKVLSVNVSGEPAVAVTTVTENVTYTFKMPERNITVDVIFLGLYEETYEITKTPPDTNMGDFVIYPLGELPESTLITVTTTPEEGFEVEAVTVSGAPPVTVNTVEPNQIYTFNMPARDVSVTVTFRREPIVNLTAGFNSTNARASRIRTEAPASVIDSAFDGNWNTFTQIQGASNLQHWFAVDLGQTRNIRTIRVGWGIADGTHGNFNGMVNYEIQVSTSLSALPEAQTYDSAGWTTVHTQRNPGNDGTNVRITQNRLNTIQLTNSVPARFVRIIQIDGLNADVAHPDGRPWTNWPSVSMFEIYTATADLIPETIPPIINPVINTEDTRIPVPVWKDTMPTLNVDLAPADSRYTAELTGILQREGEDFVPATGTTFLPGTVYAYDFVLESNEEGAFFNVTTAAGNPLPAGGLPGLFLINPTGVQRPVTVSTDATDENPVHASEWVVRHVFAATESNIIPIAFSGLIAPYAGGSVPTATNLGTGTATHAYTGIIIIEEDDDGWAEFTDATYAAGTVYRFNIELEADDPDFVFVSTGIPQVGGKTATNVVLSDNDTKIAFTFTFDATEPPKTATIENDTVTGSGLTAVAKLVDGTDDTTGIFSAGETVNVQVTVTGTATVGTIYTARLTSDCGVDFTFVPGNGTTASAIATRNIGREEIPTTSHTAGNWTFNFTFPMPDEDVFISLENTFRNDIAPGRPNLLTTTMSSGMAEAARFSRNAFNGEYTSGTANVNNQRWEHDTAGTGGPLTIGRGNWIMVDLGSNYNIKDIVFRQRNSNGFLRIFQIYTSSDEEVWDEMSEFAWDESGRGGTRLTDEQAEEWITDNDKWNLAWDVTITETNLTDAANRISYVPLFVSETNVDGSYQAVNLHTTAADNANGPYTIREGLPSTGRRVIFTPQTGRYVLLYIIAMGNEANNANFGASLLNFEIYGTPAP